MLLRLVRYRRLGDSLLICSFCTYKHTITIYDLDPLVSVIVNGAIRCVRWSSVRQFEFDVARLLLRVWVQDPSGKAGEYLVADADTRELVGLAEQLAAHRAVQVDPAGIPREFAVRLRMGHAFTLIPKSS